MILLKRVQARWITIREWPAAPVPLSFLSHRFPFSTLWQPIKMAQELLMCIRLT